MAAPADAPPEFGEAWKGRATLQALFAGSVKDWGNEAVLGVAASKGGELQGWFEWESYRELDISVTAVARSLIKVLGQAPTPGSLVGVLGPANPEAIRVWLACSALRLAPVFLPAGLEPAELRAALTATTLAALFVHESQAAALLEAAAAGGEPACAPAPLVVVWGAGSQRSTEPAADVVAGLSSAGVGAVLGFEAFKRSHFTASHAFAELPGAQPGDTAAVVISKGGAPGPAGGQALADVAATLARAGLGLSALTQAELVRSATSMLRAQQPALEQAEPYVPGENDGRAWSGKPAFPSLAAPTAVAGVPDLTRLAAGLAAGGRIACPAPDRDDTPHWPRIVANLQPTLA